MGHPTDQQEKGMKRMFQIMQKAGKTTDSISYDFQFE